METPSAATGDILRPDPGPSFMMPFIVSSNADEVDQATRKLIRSHVMRGKKQKRTRQAGLVRPKSISPVQKTQVKLQDVIDLYMAQQPGRFGTHLYFVDFPREIEPSMLLKMAQVSTAAMRIIFPLLMGIGFHLDGNGWLYPAGRDVAALHINAFAIQSFIDRVLNHQSVDRVNPVATLHHQKGLVLLRKRLDGDDDEAKVSDDTIGAVLKLASAAKFDGDVEVATQHIKGLRKMIDLRGGINAFGGNPKLLVEIWRCDLDIALLANTDPVFYILPSEPVPEYPEQVISSFSPRMRCLEGSRLVQDLSLDLATAWQAMRKFCLLANLGTQTQMLIQPATIYGTMTAVMYRLVRLKYVPGSLDETLRLGLLCFTHHSFLQWKDICLPRHGFTSHYREYFACHKLEDTIPPGVMLWLFMTGAVSVFRISEEPWLAHGLRRQAERCGVRSWKDMQDTLRASMWIPLLDEERGKLTYDWLGTSLSYTNGADKGE